MVRPALGQLPAQLLCQRGQCVPVQAVKPFAENICVLFHTAVLSVFS